MYDEINKVPETYCWLVTAQDGDTVLYHTAQIPSGESVAPNPPLFIAPLGGATYNLLLTTGVNDNECTDTLRMALVIPSIIPPIDTVKVAICDAQLPYTYNGKIYTEAGLYLDTLIDKINSIGCDSMAYIKLIVLNTIYTNVDSTICYGESIVWNGILCNTSGEYRCTFLNVAGCDSIVTLHLTVSDRNISGTVKQGSTPVSGDMILYIKRNEKLVAIAAVSVENNGTYIFTGVDNGDYYIKFVPDVSECAMSTYYTNTVYGDLATKITVNCISVDNINITPFPCFLMNGTGYISGIVYKLDEGSYSPPYRAPALEDGIMSDEPAEDVAVVLEKADDIVTPVGETTTDASGAFEFKDVPEGHYSLKLDYPGSKILVAVDSIITIIYGETDTIRGLVFVVEDTELSIRSVTAEEEIIKIYPNPTTGQLTINNLQLIINNIQIFDMVGRLVGSYPCGRPDYSGTATINISHLPQGLYILRAGSQVVKIIKK